MKLIVCLDDKNGMTFNNRRQSRDIMVIRDIEDVTNNNELYITEYSKSLFENECYKIAVSVREVSNLDCYFLNETEMVSDIEDKIDSIIVYRWNRIYPSSVIFDLDLSKYTIVDKKDFKGNSHDNITRIMYIK